MITKSLWFHFSAVHRNGKYVTQNDNTNSTQCVVYISRRFAEALPLVDSQIPATPAEHKNTKALNHLNSLTSAASTFGC